MTDEEVEVFDIDWEGLREDALLTSLHQNTVLNEPGTSWIGCTGPLDNLNEVHVEPPSAPSDGAHLASLEATVSHLIASDPAITVDQLWTLALAEAQQLFGSQIF